MSDLDIALRELESYPAQEALAILDAVTSKRQQDRYIAYWKPYPEGNQPKVFERFTAEKKVMGVLGGNRSGKTEVGAAIAVAWFLGKDYFKDEPAWEWVKNLPIPPPPNVIWVVGLDFPTVRDVLWGEKLRRGKDHPALLPNDPALIRKISDSEYQIHGTNGSLLTCKSADSGREKFQGASVDLVWIDEEPDVEIYDECFQRTADCAGKILITLTPLTDTASGVRSPWVFDLWEDWRAGARDLEFVTLSVLDNPFVPAEEKTRLKVKWAGHYEERARLYGEFIQRSGLVYPQWDPAKHLIAPRPIPRQWRRVACIDPAATGTTACLWCAVHPNGNLYFYREYYERDLVVSDHARNILARNAGDRVDLWLIDPKWGTQRNAETHKTNQQLYRDSGIPVRLAVVGEDYGLNASREYIQATIDPTSPHNKAYFFSDLTDFQSEIKHYVWDFFQKGEQKGQSKDKPRKRNDHLMNSFQYIAANNPRPNRGGDEMSAGEYKKWTENNSYT